MPRMKLELNRKPCRTQMGYYSDQMNTMGFSFNDLPFVPDIVADAGSYIQQSVIDPVKETAVEYVGEEKVASLSTQIESQIQKTGASLEEQAKAKATDLATQYAQQQMQTKEVQDSGIRAGFDAAATQAIAMKDTIINEGPMAFAKKYPVATGVAGLLGLAVVFRVGKFVVAK